MGKRLFDILVAAFGLLLLAPALLLVALWVRLDSPGPAIFRQQRAGLGGRPFLIHKFRTMRCGCGGPGLTLQGDARVTRAGRWLRRCRVDELPQLWDVLRGVMSLVGPRPELPRYLAQAPLALRARALAVRPGMTDPAALAWIDEGARLARAADPETEYVQHILPLKLQAAAEYAERASLRTDLAVLWRTARTLWTLA